MATNVGIYLSYTNVVTFDFPYFGKKGFLFFIPKRLHNSKLTLHFQKLLSWFFFISHTFPQSHYAGKSPNHSDAQQYTATHTHTIVLVDGDHTHTQVWTLSYVVSFLYAYGFFRGGHRTSDLCRQTSSLVFSSLFSNFFSSLLYYETCLLFSIMKLFMFSFCEYTINFCYVSL